MATTASKTHTLCEPKCASTASSFTTRAFGCLAEGFGSSEKQGTIVEAQVLRSSCHVKAAKITRTTPKKLSLVLNTHPMLL